VEYIVTIFDKTLQSIVVHCLTEMCCFTLIRYYKRKNHGCAKVSNAVVTTD